MTPMLTIADASDMAVWGWQTWFFLFAAVALLTMTGLIIGVVARPHNVTLMTEDRPSYLDNPTQCHLRCGLNGTITRVTTEHVGLETVRVCPGHSDEGDRRGWWAA